MKFVLFAHVPPPHHGQSTMVKLMREGLSSGDFGEFEILHVDARFSKSMEDVGSSGLKKGLLAFRYAFQALRYRFFHGAKVLYFVPAPPKTSAMVRDWVIMALCRPFFPVIVCHWHAVGLGLWTQKHERGKNRMKRWKAKLNRFFLRNHAVSLSLTEWGTQDTDVFSPRKTLVVPNGIPDPCQDYESRLANERIKRRELLLSGGATTYEVIFLGHCYEGKGLWDAMEAVAQGNTKLAQQGRATKLHLKVAGEFPKQSDEEKYHAIADQLGKDQFTHLGFVQGEVKTRLFENADCLCFPTKYDAESFGLVAAEALAFGIPPVCSDWRMLPDLMNSVGLPVAKTGDPDSLANEIIASIGRDEPNRLRDSFLNSLSDKKHLQILADALRESGER